MQDQAHKAKVKFYAGYTGEETPRSVFFKGKEFAIDRILERKKILDPKTQEVRIEYTIELKGRKAILKIFSSGDCEIVDLS